MKHLTYPDVLAIFISWIGAGAVAYIVQDSFVGLIAVCAGYYLSKWIVLKKDDG